MNTFFKKSSLLHTITAVGMAATAIVYALAKAKENSPIIIALLVIGALLELFVASDKAPKYFECPPFAAALVSVAMFINLAFDEIGDILSKINMDGLSTSWIASAVLLVICMICAAVSTVWGKK